MPASNRTGAVVMRAGRIAISAAGCSAALVITPPSAGIAGFVSNAEREATAAFRMAACGRGVRHGRRRGDDDDAGIRPDSGPRLVFSGEVAASSLPAGRSSIANPFAPVAATTAAAAPAPEATAASQAEAPEDCGVGINWGSPCGAPAPPTFAFTPAETAATYSSGLVPCAAGPGARVRLLSPQDIVARLRSSVAAIANAAHRAAAEAALLRGGAPIWGGSVGGRRVVPLCLPLHAGASMLTAAAVDDWTVEAVVSMRDVHDARTPRPRTMAQHHDGGGSAGGHHGGHPIFLRRNDSGLGTPPYGYEPVSPPYPPYGYVAYYVPDSPPFDSDAHGYGHGTRGGRDDDGDDDAGDSGATPAYPSFLHVHSHPAAVRAHAASRAARRRVRDSDSKSDSDSGSGSDDDIVAPSRQARPAAAAPAASAPAREVIESANRGEVASASGACSTDGVVASGASESDAAGADVDAPVLTVIYSPSTRTRLQVLSLWLEAVPEDDTAGAAGTASVANSVESSATAGGDDGSLRGHAFAARQPLFTQLAALAKLHAQPEAASGRSAWLAVADASSAAAVASASADETDIALQVAAAAARHLLHFHARSVASAVLRDRIIGGVDMQVASVPVPAPLPVIPGSRDMQQLIRKHAETELTKAALASAGIRVSFAEDPVRCAAAHAEALGVFYCEHAPERAAGAAADVARHGAAAWYMAEMRYSADVAPYTAGLDMALPANSASASAAGGAGAPTAGAPTAESDAAAPASASAAAAAEPHAAVRAAHIAAIQRFYGDKEPGKAGNAEAVLAKYGVGIWRALAMKYNCDVAPYIAGLDMSWSPMAAPAAPASAVTAAPSVVAPAAIRDPYADGSGWRSNPFAVAPPQNAVAAAAPARNPFAAAPNPFAPALANPFTAAPNPFAPPNAANPFAAAAALPAPVAAVAAADPQARRAAHLAALRRFYAARDATKVGNAEGVLAIYGAAVWAALADRYGCDVSAFTAGLDMTLPPQSL